jgi:hypothetical protein
MDMSHSHWFADILLEFNDKILLLNQGSLDRQYFDLPSNRVEKHEKIIDSLQAKVEKSTGILLENPDLIGIYLHLSDQNISEYRFLFHQTLTDWDVIKLKIRSSQLQPVKFFSKQELDIWTHNTDEKFSHNLRQAQIRQFADLDTSSLQYFVVREHHN